MRFRQYIKSLFIDPSYNEKRTIKQLYVAKLFRINTILKLLTCVLSSKCFEWPINWVLKLLPYWVNYANIVYEILFPHSQVKFNDKIATAPHGFLRNAFVDGFLVTEHIFLWRKLKWKCKKVFQYSWVFFFKNIFLKTISWQRSWLNQAVKKCNYVKLIV